VSGGAPAGSSTRTRTSALHGARDADAPCPKTVLGTKRSAWDGRRLSCVEYIHKSVCIDRKNCRPLRSMRARSAVPSMNLKPSGTQLLQTFTRPPGAPAPGALLPNEVLRFARGGCQAPHSWAQERCFQASFSGTSAFCHVRLRLRSSSPPFGDQDRDPCSNANSRLRSSRRPSSPPIHASPSGAPRGFRVAWRPQSPAKLRGRP
jgi:hypothetical protein